MHPITPCVHIYQQLLFEIQDRSVPKEVLKPSVKKLTVKTLGVKCNTQLPLLSISKEYLAFGNIFECSRIPQLSAILLADPEQLL